MFKQILFVQWKWTRSTLFSMTVLAIIVPTLTMRLSLAQSFNQTPSSLVEFTTILGAMLAALSVISGIAVQEMAWRTDITGRYVYALSLPITWGRLVWYRAAATMLLLLIPAMGLFVGGGVALSFVNLPSTLHGYAGGVAVRYFLGSLIAFALWGVLLRLSGKRASVVLLLLLLVSVMIPVGLEFAGYGSFNSALLRVITDAPSPLAIYFSRWALIDV